MKKYISFGMMVVILMFALSFVVITTFSNPLHCESTKSTFLTCYTVFALIMTGYWIFFIVETFKSKTWYHGVILLVGILSFISIPSYRQYGLFSEIGTCLFLLNIVIWCIYYAIYRDLRLLILIIGWMFFLLLMPYSEILWD